MSKLDEAVQLDKLKPKAGGNWARELDLKEQWLQLQRDRLTAADAHKDQRIKNLNAALRAARLEAKTLRLKLRAMEAIVDAAVASEAKLLRTPSHKRKTFHVGKVTTGRYTSAATEPLSPVQGVPKEELVPAQHRCKHCKQSATALGPVGMWQHCYAHEDGSLLHEMEEVQA
jgi:hypothetical protein